MNVKVKQCCLVIILILLIFCVLIYPHTSDLGNSDNHLKQSELYKVMLHQLTKVVHSSIHHVSEEVKNISDITFMYKDKITTEENMKVNIGNGKEKIKIEDDNCTKKEVKLSRTALPITGLFSFPGSGNTWTRHLIQQMTGTK